MVNEQTDAKCWAKIVGRVVKMPWALPHIHLNTNKLIKWRPVRWCGKINCGFAKRSVFETPTHEIQFYAQSSHSIRDFCFFFHFSSCFLHFFSSGHFLAQLCRTMVKWSMIFVMPFSSPSSSGSFSLSLAITSKNIEMMHLIFFAMIVFLRSVILVV